MIRAPQCVLVAALLALASSAVGCRSAYIEATVRNSTATAIPLVEVDYPSASFGRQQLAPNAEFRYRFKILGTGAAKVIWTDAAHHDHTVPGPVLHEGDEGRVTITLTPTSANWNLVLTSR